MNLEIISWVLFFQFSDNYGLITFLWSLSNLYTKKNNILNDTESFYELFKLVR